ncbi:hypothetical protein MASR1M97_05530 [Candidatus Desulfobacillus denitrificans]
MPSKTSKKKASVELPRIPKEVIEQLVSGPMTAEAVNAASMAFKKALIERALGRSSPTTWATRRGPKSRPTPTTIATGRAARPS